MESRLPTGALVVAVSKDGQPHYEAKWRWEGRQVKRRLGPAWLVANGDGWTRRKGRPPEGWLDEKRAVVAMSSAISLYADEEAAQFAEEAAAELRFTFAELADEWLDDRRSVGGLKHTTLTDYEAMLRRPDAAPRKRGSVPQARIMRAFGERPAAELDADEVARFLRALDRDPAIGPRTVNKHRQVLHAIFAFGVRQKRIPVNPVADTPKRRENDPAEILTYTPEQVYAIANAARAGAHRDRVATTEEEREAQRLEDEQDAAIIIVAAFCGLRMGELLALRWRHVLWDARRLHVVRSYSLRTESSTKSRKGRTVPLADQPAKALADLSLRERFTSPADLVFCSRTGDHLDDSALRRRYKKARDAAMRQDRDMDPLRFHDLRHTFGTLAASRFDAVNLQAMLGHADSRTTARYLHARPAAEDADRLTQIFGGAAAGGAAITAAPEQT